MDFHFRCFLDTNKWNCSTYSENGKAIKIPRIEVSECKSDDIQEAGVYFLFCKEEDGSDSVYIGE